MTGLFETVLRLSIAGSLTSLLMFGLSLPLRNKLPKAWLYGLWLVALLRFVIPVSFTLPLNIPPLDVLPTFASAGASADTAPAPHNNITYHLSPAQGSIPLAAENANPTSAPAAVITHSAAKTDVISLISAAWLAGAGMLLLYNVSAYSVTIRKLKRHRTLITADKVPVYESGLISTPILTGLFRPAVYLPKDFKCAALALRHELCHLRRCDLWSKWFVQLVVCLHWFNPLIYLFKREMNRLSEMACDESVVRHMDDDGRRTYGHMLLETLRASSGLGGPMIAALGTNKHWLKERMHGIMKKHIVTKKAILAMVIIVACVSCSALLAGAALTDNSAPADKLSGADTPILPANAIAAKTAGKQSATNTELPFVNDPDVLGAWDKVAAVKNPEDFDPSQMTAEDQNPMYLVFSENGATNFPSWSWTKGHLNLGDMAYRGYEVKEMTGSKYLFLNFAFNEPTMNYFVFKYTSDSTTPVKFTDNIDLAFADDPAVIGTWKSVDFVRNISDFDPAHKAWQLDLYLKNLVFLENGKMSVPFATWTNGAVMHHGDNTASAYEIKEINGSTYLFFEWKSGDYVFLHEKPYYYVLEKAD